jgi:hypothetical protein
MRNTDWILSGLGQAPVAGCFNIVISVLDPYCWGIFEKLHNW